MPSAALVLSVLAFSTSVVAQTPTSTMHIGGRTLMRTNVAFGHDNTRKEFSFEYETQLHQWPGIYFETRFNSEELDINIDDPHNNYKLYIDEKAPIVLRRVKAVYEIRGLTSGWHRVRLEKISESQAQVGGVDGFNARGGKLESLPSRARQIEFIGDSYTVGYGNMSGKRQCTPDELHDTTDTSQAYGPLTAKAFNADYQINAFSGRGIVRNYDGFAGDPLPGLYPYILFDKKDAYNDEHWKPQVIVIGLGGNDFSTPVKPGEKWKDEAALKADYEQSFVAFVKTLRAKHPQASFLLTKYEGPTVAEEVEKVAALLRASGETRLDTIGMDGFTLNGCDWHLDSNDHKRISEQLTGYFKAHPELWQGK